MPLQINNYIVLRKEIYNDEKQILSINLFPLTF